LPLIQFVNEQATPKRKTVPPSRWGLYSGWKLARGELSFRKKSPVFCSKLAPIGRIGAQFEPVFKQPLNTCQANLQISSSFQTLFCLFSGHWNIFQRQTCEPMEGRAQPLLGLHLEAEDWPISWAGRPPASSLSSPLGTLSASVVAHLWPLAAADETNSIDCSQTVGVLHWAAVWALAELAAKGRLADWHRLCSAAEAVCSVQCAVCSVQWRLRQKATRAESDTSA